MRILASMRPNWQHGGTHEGKYLSPRLARTCFCGQSRRVFLTPRVDSVHLFWASTAAPGEFISNGHGIFFPRARQTIDMPPTYQLELISSLKKRPGA